MTEIKNAEISEALDNALQAVTEALGLTEAGAHPLNSSIRNDAIEARNDARAAIVALAKLAAGEDPELSDEEERSLLAAMENAAKERFVEMGGHPESLHGRLFRYGWMACYRKFTVEGLL